MLESTRGRDEKKGHDEEKQPKQMHFEGKSLKITIDYIG